MNTVTNLRKLADYIEQHVPQEKLNMGFFRLDDEGYLIPFKSHTDCGTSGCALGWGPFVEGLEPQEQDFHNQPPFEEDPRLDWVKYSDRLFPSLPFFTFEWDEVFSEELSSDKIEVIARLRNKANDLESIQ